MNIDYFFTQQFDVDDFDETMLIYYNPTCTDSILLPIVYCDKYTLFVDHGQPQIMDLLERNVKEYIFDNNVFYEFQEYI